MGTMLGMSALSVHGCRNPFIIDAAGIFRKRNLNANAKIHLLIEKCN